MTSHPSTWIRTLARSSRLIQLLALVILMVGAAGLFLSPRAGAQASDSTTTKTSSSSSTSGGVANPNSYDMSALANALDILVSDSSLPFAGDLAYEVGAWGASSTLTSIGQSNADAGVPYAPSIYSLPGTIDGLGQGNFPPVPALPGYVSASYPSTPSDNETQGGYEITSTASPTSAEGTVRLGVQPAGSPNSTIFAEASTTANDDGSVTSHATAGADLLDIGSLLDIGNISSSLSMTEQANGAPTVTSSTNLGTITLLSLPSGLDASGFHIFGVGIPIDLNKSVIATLDTVLASTGIKLTYLPETIIYTDGTSSTGATPNAAKTIESIDSSTLEVNLTRNIPSQGPVSVTVTLGRVYLTTTDAPGLSAIAGTLPLGSGLLSSPSSLGSFGGGSFSPVAPVAPSPLTSVMPSSPTTTPPARTVVASPAFEIEKGPPVNSVYLVLVLVALVIALGSQALRHLAVRLTIEREENPMTVRCIDNKETAPCCTQQ